MFHHLVDAGSTLTAGVLTRLRSGVPMRNTERYSGIDASVLEDRTLFSASPISGDLPMAEQLDLGADLDPATVGSTGLLFVDSAIANTDQLIAQLSQDADGIRIIRLNSVEKASIKSLAQSYSTTELNQSTLFPTATRVAYCLGIR